MNINLNFVGKTNFAKLQGELKNVNNSLANISKDANRCSDGFKGMDRAFGGLNKVLGVSKLYMLSNVLAGAIKASLDMIEIQNMFNVAMGEGSLATGEFADALSRVYGLDPTNVKSTIGTFGLLARSMGMNTEQAETLSKNMYQLGLDLSSLYNVPINQVMADLRSGLIGQSETVYKYGIDVTEAGIAQEALNQGITTSVRNMSQGEKMALRYSASMRSGTLAFGDFANTINSPANQLKILHERIVQLSRAIGSIFIPILSAVLPWINAFVLLLTKLATSIAMFFGYKPPEQKNMANSFSSMGESADGATKKIGKTAKAVKAFQSALVGIDEINLLPQDNGDSEAVGGAGGEGVSSGSILPDMSIFDKYDDWYKNVKSTADELAERMLPVLKKIGIVVGIIALGFLSWKLASAITELIRVSKLIREIYMFTSGKQLMGLSEDASKLMKSLTPTAGMMSMLKLAGGIFLILGGLILAFIGIRDILMESEPTLKSFGIALAGIALIAGGIFLIFGGIPALIALAVGALVLLGVYIYKYWDEIKAKTIEVWDAIKEFFSGTWDALKEKTFEILISIGDVFRNSWEEIKNFVIVKIPEIFNEIIKWFAELPNQIAYHLGYALGSIVRWAIDTYNYLTVKIPEIIGAVTNWFAELPSKIYNGISTFYAKVIEWGNNVKNWFSTKVTEVVNAVVDWFAELPNRIMSAINAVGSRIVAWGKDVKNWFAETVPNAINAVVDWFKELPSKIADAIHGLYGTIKGIGSYILDGIMDGLNAVGNKIKHWADSFVRGFKDALGIHSPSKIMRDEVGQFIGLGIQVGLERTTDGIVGTAMNISDGIKGAFGDVSVKPNVDYALNSDFGAGMIDTSLGFGGSMDTTTILKSDDIGKVMYQAVLGAMTEVMSNSEGRDVVLKVGESELGRASINGINRVTKQEGKLLLNI